MIESVHSGRITEPGVADSGITARSVVRAVLFVRIRVLLEVGGPASDHHRTKYREGGYRMFVRIRTIMADFNRGRDYIFVPGSIPELTSERIALGEAVAELSETSTVEPELSLQQS